MKTNHRLNVSDATADLLAILTPYRGHEEIVMPGSSFEALLDRLDLIRRMALESERELGAFRLLEAGRFARGTMEEVATDAAGALVLDPEGKVVRPDFGRRS